MSLAGRMGLGSLKDMQFEDRACLIASLSRVAWGRVIVGYKLRASGILDSNLVQGPNTAHVLANTESTVDLHNLAGVLLGTYNTPAWTLKKALSGLKAEVQNTNTCNVRSCALKACSDTVCGIIQAQYVTKP